MRVRSHLLLLTLGTLLPLVLFGATATVLLAQREKHRFQQGATERTRAVLTAVDAELAGYLTTLQALATSRNLETIDPPAFHDEAGRALASQPNWRRVSLALPSGDVILDATAPLGAALPRVTDRDSFSVALRSGKATIGSLFRQDGEFRFSARVPVGTPAPKYVLSAQVDPKAILRLLGSQRLPPDWVGVVLDARRRIVARTVDHESKLGALASESLRAALQGRANEGWFHGYTLEGNDVYTPYNRSDLTGWTVAMGIPAPEVEAGAWRMTWGLTIGVLLAVAIAMFLATTLSRRISLPIASLATVARAFQSGAPPPSPHAFRVTEVDEVQQALLAAAETVRERENALRAADRAKDEFLAMLGHELRNPLSALASGAQVLELVLPAGGPAGDATAVITRQIGHMTRLVDDLLDVGRVTRGKVTLTRQPLDLGEVVCSVLRDQRGAGRLDEHALTTEVESVWIDADEARVEQIVANLVGNAIKYTPPGGEINARVRRHGSNAVLELADTGIGLTPELIPRVFDLFVQGERSLDRSLGGLGIGLTLVKCLTELHGGTVTADSAGPGHGARFTVTLPAIEEPVDTRSGHGNGPAAAAPARPRRILLIEDNDDARRTLCAALTLQGHQVVEAADGVGGVAAAVTNRPEVAVVDIGLPGVDGYEVARQLRATPAGHAIALVALTGYGTSDTARRSHEAGFDRYLCKPVSPAVLTQVIEATLASARADGDGDGEQRRS